MAAAACESGGPRWAYRHEIALLRSVMSLQAAQGLSRADRMVGIEPLLEGLVAEGGVLNGFTSRACLWKLYQLRDRYRRADLAHAHPNPAAERVHALSSRVWLPHPLLPETMAAQKAEELARLTHEAITTRDRAAALNLRMISLIDSVYQAHLPDAPARANMKDQVARAKLQIEAVISDLRNKLPSGTLDVPLATVDDEDKDLDDEDLNSSYSAVDA